MSLKENSNILLTIYFIKLWDINDNWEKLYSKVSNYEVDLSLAMFKSSSKCKYYSYIGSAVVFYKKIKSHHIRIK